MEKPLNSMCGAGVNRALSDSTGRVLCRAVLVTSVFCVSVLVLIGWRVGLADWCYGGFPTIEEVDSFLRLYPSEDSFDRRVTILKTLLWRMRNPESQQSDEILGHALWGLAALFTRTHDESILVAMDYTATDAMGGFGCSICSFYRTLSQDEVFLRRVRENPNARRALSRCEGCDFSHEELTRLLDM